MVGIKLCNSGRGQLYMFIVTDKLVGGRPDLASGAVDWVRVVSRFQESVAAQWMQSRHLN